MSEKNKTEFEKKKSKKVMKKNQSEKRMLSEDVKVITEDSVIREKAKLLGSYLLKKLKEYKFVFLLDLIIFLLLFYLIPIVVLEVKTIIWMIAFVVFTMLPTIGFYGMDRFKDKQVVIGFFFIYLLIFLSLDRFALMELYGITSRGTLDYTPAWLDAVFTTCIIVFFQYISILIVKLVKKMRKQSENK